MKLVSIAGEQSNEIIVKKSKFIATATHIETVEEGLAFVNSLRKKYHDATHNCYAILTVDGAKYNDDFEPQGTAGLPIFEVIKRNNLTNICVVVTRYFGGIKLGGGGLIRSYADSCAQVLKLCEFTYTQEVTNIVITVDYSLVKLVECVIPTYAKLKSVSYDTKVCFCVKCVAEEVDKFCSYLTDITCGKALIEIQDTQLAIY